MQVSAVGDTCFVSLSLARASDEGARVSWVMSRGFDERARKPLFFLGTREWRNRQTRTVQVRVPVMEWGFNSPLAHD